MASFQAQRDDDFTVRYVIDGESKQCRWWENEGGRICFDTTGQCPRESDLIRDYLERKMQAA